MSTTTDVSTATSDHKANRTSTFNGMPYHKIKAVCKTYGVELLTALTISFLMAHNQWDEVNLIHRLKKAEMVDDFDWLAITNYDALVQELQKYNL